MRDALKQNYWRYLHCFLHTNHQICIKKTNFCVSANAGIVCGILGIDKAMFIYLNDAAIICLSLAQWKHNPSSDYFLLISPLLMQWWARITFIIVLTHWGQYKMADIFQTFSNAFSWMKMFEFRIQVHWTLFLGIQLTMIQDLFR